MTRLINADALESLCSTPGLIHVAMIVKQQPTIDAAPVIRCKDCTYWDSEITQTAVPNMRSCIYWGRIGTLGIDYCSRAVRKEE